MESRTLAVLGLLAVAVVFALTWEEQDGQGEADPWDTTTPDTTTPDTSSDTDTGKASITDEITDMARRAFNLWQPPAAYAATIAAAEQRHAIPNNMLARLLYQECRWRDDIISGRLRSPAGAVGIAQFMPATARELGIDPLDTTQAINAAGQYLAGLYRKFGNWTMALAAYNWGQGNVQRKGLAAAPLETRNYYSQILADVNAANGSAWA